MDNSALVETVIITLSILIGILVTILGPKLADKFCSVKVTEEAMLRQEQVQNMMKSKRIPIILSNITGEERDAILLQVLEVRHWPWSQTEFSNPSSSSSTTPQETGGGHEPYDTACRKSETKISDDEEFQQIDDTQSTDGVTQQQEHQNTCAICMEDYKDEEDLIVGATCSHMYHKDCVLKWIASSHICCPYCRDFFFDVSTFLSVAQKVLGSERYQEVLVVPNDSNAITSITTP